MLKNTETTDSAYVKDENQPELAPDKNSMAQIGMCFEVYRYKDYSQGESKGASFYIAGKQYYNGMVWSAWNTGCSLYSLEMFQYINYKKPLSFFLI